MSRCTPIRFVFGNAARRSIIRSSGQTGDLRNLSNEHRSRLCHWPVNQPVVIELELAQLYDIDTIALSRHNFSKRATLTIERIRRDGSAMDTQIRRLFEEDDPMTRRPCIDWRPGIDTFCGISLADVAPWPATIPFWLPELYGIYPAKIRITIEDTGNPANRIELGLLFAGKRLELDYNFDWGNSLTGLTNGQLSRLASGYALRSKLRRRVRSLNLSLSNMSDADRERLYAADSEYPNEPVLVSAYPTGTAWQQDQYTLVGALEQSPGYSHTHTGQHSTGITIIEV